MTTRDAPDAPAPPGRGAHLLAMACVLVCAVTIVASVDPAPPVLHNDGPQALFAAEVHHRYREPALAFADAFTLHWPTTSRGPLELHLAARALGAGPWLAHAVVLDVALLAWLGATFALVLRLCPRRWPLGIVGLGTAFQLSFELGVLPFFLASSGALVVVAAEAGRTRSRLARDLAMAAALYLLARVHVLPCALAGVAVVAMRGAGARPVRDVVAAVLAGVPALLVAWTTVGGFSGAPTDAGGRWLTVDGPVALVRDFLPGPAWRGGVVLALAAISAALVVRERRTRPRVELALAVTAVLFLVVTMAAPEDLGGWQLFRPRLLPLAFAFLLALLPLERLSTRDQALAAVALLLFGLHGALQSRAEVARWRRIFAPVVAGLRLAPPQPRHWATLVTVVDEPVPPTRITPWLHVAQVAAIDLGGRPAYLQDDEPALHTLLATTPSTSLVSPPFPGMWPKAWAADRDGERHAAVVRAFAAWGLAVDGLVVYGRLDDAEALWAGGQDVTFAQELAFDRVIYATDSVGCVVDVEVSGPAEPLTVGIGFVPGDDPLDVAVVNGSAGVARFTRAPCGDVWVELDGARCSGADARGRLRAQVDRRMQPAVIRCERAFPAPAP